MMFQPCFLAVEKKERMSAKSIAPSDERKPAGPTDAAPDL
jgi:hypothetical protein